MVDSRYDEPDIPPEPDDPAGSGLRGALFSIAFVAWLASLFIAGRVMNDATLASWLLVGVPVAAVVALVVVGKTVWWRRSRRGTDRRS